MMAHVFSSDHLTWDNQLVYSSLERPTSPAPCFTPLPLVLWLGLKPLSGLVCLLCHPYVGQFVSGNMSITSDLARRYDITVKSLVCWLSPLPVFYMFPGLRHLSISWIYPPDLAV